MRSLRILAILVAPLAIAAIHDSIRVPAPAEATIQVAATAMARIEGRS